MPPSSENNPAIVPDEAGTGEMISGPTLSGQPGKAAGHAVGKLTSRHGPAASEAKSHPCIGFGLLLLIFRAPPGYPGDNPCPTKGAAIQRHNDEDQSTLQRGTPSIRQERYGEAELR
jgi:hypothetical protein